MNKRLITILLLIGVFVFTAGISYTFFSRNGSKNVVSPASTKIALQNGAAKFDETQPKTEPCPLNGALYSKQQKQWWDTHRPLGIMIENHEDARPQSGISSADVVYEIIAEGGITRFLTVFYCQDAGFVGPVRSARTYFLDFISEYGNYPLYAHVGGANTDGPADALSQIETYGWGVGGHGNDMNQFSIACPIFCRYEDRLGHPTATEHTMYSTTEKLWNYAAKYRKLTNVDKAGVAWDEKFVPYTFKDEAKLPERGDDKTIHLEFWTGYYQYSVDWAYDKASNLYKRTNGSKPHLDNNTKKQLTTKNVIILYMQQSNANDGYENNLHMLYKDKGTGKAVVFMDGKRIDGTWKKNNRTSRLLVYDANSTAVTFDRGTLWFEILPTDGVLTVK